MEGRAEVVTPHVTGLDLSLTSTGIAWMDGTTTTLKPGERRGLDRIRWICARIIEGTARSELAVVEGPAYSRALGAGHHEAAGLWWAVLSELDRYSVPVAVVTPGGLKKYATGRGNADKTAMAVAAMERARLKFASADECDAWWLRAMGLDHLGHPPLQLPAGHRQALAKAQWPDLPGSAP